MPLCRYAYTLAFTLSSTIYVIAAIRSITSCVCDIVLIMWWFNEHMHLHLCRYMFIMLCASPPALVRSPAPPCYIESVSSVPPDLPCYTESVGIKLLRVATVFIFHSACIYIHESQSKKQALKAAQLSPTENLQTPTRLQCSGHEEFACMITV